MINIKTNVSDKADVIVTKLKMLHVKYKSEHVCFVLISYINVRKVLLFV